MSILSDTHRHMLEVESGIDPDVISERGYFTATTKVELARLGFPKSQQLAPGLVFPVFNVRGEQATFQLRPDNPRANPAGKMLKYETVARSKMVVDVPPRARDKPGDPSIPLWITEGVKKADAAVTHGLVCIALLGVWNWRGTNDDGGKTVLADFEHIAWNGRTVYLAFDSDVIEKDPVWLALTRLGQVLKQRQASVRVVRIPNGRNGQKVGLDDYLAAGRSA